MLGKAVTPITPPRSAMAAIASSVRLRGLRQTASALQWLATTGSDDAATMSNAVRRPACETSSRIPASFAARTTRAPRALKPSSAASVQPSPNGL